MTQRTGEFEVEKFDGKINFVLWQILVKDILVQQGLHKTLKGAQAKPTDMSDEDWEELDLKACSTIRLRLSKEVLSMIMNETTAAGIWSKLETMYKRKSMIKWLHLHREHVNLKMKEGDTMHEHIVEFFRIVAELCSIEVTLDETIQVALLLNTLPDSYDDLVSIMLDGVKSTSVHEVVGFLLANEIRMKASDGVECRGSQADGLMVKGKDKEREPSELSGRLKSRSGEVIECYECHKKGHIRRHCPDVWL